MSVRNLNINTNENPNLPARAYPPEMILFDYGHTLLCEPSWNPLRGEIELYKYLTKNLHNLTAEEICDFSESLFGGFHDVRWLKNGCEVSEYTLMRLKNEYLGLEYSITPEEAEIILFNGISSGDVMPDADKMLDYLNSAGIRTAVVSNNSYSSAALDERFNRLLPNNNFEFIISSADYAVRKPNPLIFNLALRKANLPAEKVWYCGDRPDIDVEGSSAVGMFPVWYDNDMECGYRDKSAEKPPSCPHLHIREWSEMVEYLKGMESK